jgi:hypothetical protein
MTIDGATSDVLQRVDFGRFDAETDEKLLDYFVQTGTASETTTGKSLVVGRKGSGKTALFRYVAATAPGHIVELDLENYVFQVHRHLKESGVTDALAYTSSWRVVIGVAAYVKIRSSLGFAKRRRGDRLLRQVGAGPDKASLGAILDWLKRVRKVKLPSIPSIADLGTLELSEGSEKVIDNSTSQFLERIEELIIDSCRRTPISILIDRLDDAWDGNLESLRLVAGAIRAARHYRVKLPQTGFAPVIVFLRTDLWDKIEFNDKNKVSQDTIYLDWAEEELEKVVDARIQKSAGVPEGEGWSTVFTTDEMRQRASARRYMLKRTLGRPRDIIAFSALARSVAINAGHTRIERPDIYEAEVQYSRHLVDELRDEIGEHIPDFATVINAIKSLRARTFTLTDWGVAAESSGIDQADRERVLDQLFEASAVGVHRAGGSQGGSSTVFRYQDRFLKATESGTLQVHLGLVKELGLTDR